MLLFTVFQSSREEYTEGRFSSEEGKAEAGFPGRGVSEVLMPVLWVGQLSLCITRYTAVEEGVAGGGGGGGGGRGAEEEEEEEEEAEAEEEGGGEEGEGEEEEGEEGVGDEG